MTCHCYSFMDKDINGSHIIGMLALVPFFLEFQLFFYLQSLDLIKLIFTHMPYIESYGQAPVSSIEKYATMF